MRVVLVDAEVEPCLRAMLEATHQVIVVSEVTSAAPPVGPAVARRKAEAVVVDVSRDRDGTGALPGVCRSVDGEGVLALGVDADAPCLRQVLRAGADGYLLKTVTVPELVDGLRRIADGQVVVDRAFTPVPPGAPPHPRAEWLTVREHEVLALLGAGADEGTLAAVLTLPPEAVARHVENLARKLSATSRTELAAAAVRLGVVA